VFAVNVNRQNQLRGADGEISLVHSVHKQQAPPPPRFPAVKEEKTLAAVLPMKKRRA